MRRSPAWSKVLSLVALLWGAACAASVSPGRTEALPKSVEEAVAILEDWLSPEDRDWILRNPRDQVTATLHLPFGTSVRNSFRLWGGNPELLASCGTDHAEECSHVLFERLWEAVREEADLGLVRELDCQFALVEAVQVDYRGFHGLRMGELLESLQGQIDRALPEVRGRLPAGCSIERLVVQATGEPDLECFVRAEFSEDGRGPVSLGMLFGWISWRNGFSVYHAPPEVEVRFEEGCAWPEEPVWFGSPPPQEVSHAGARSPTALMPPQAPEVPPPAVTVEAQGMTLSEAMQNSRRLCWTFPLQSPGRPHFPLFPHRCWV